MRDKYLSIHNDDDVDLFKNIIITQLLCGTMFYNDVVSLSFSLSIPCCVIQINEISSLRNWNHVIAITNPENIQMKENLIHSHINTDKFMECTGVKYVRRVYNKEKEGKECDKPFTGKRIG